MSIKAIIFDFGQVLNEPEDTVASRAHRAQLARRLDLEPAELWPYLFEGEAARQWLTGRMTWNEFWTAVLEPRGIDDAAEIEAFAEEIFAETGQISEQMVSLLQELKGKYKLAVLSNATWTEEEMRAMLQNDFGLSPDLFDVVVTSTSFGVTKPDPRIYWQVLDRLGVLAEEAIFTDDLASFTAAAARLGIHTHTFTTPRALRDFLVQMDVLTD